MQRNAARNPATRHSTAQHGGAQHGKAQPATAGQGTTQHDTARHGGAGRSAAQPGTARRSRAKHSTARESTPKDTTAPRQRTLTVCPTRSSRLRPWKGRKHTHSRGTSTHRPTTHRLKAATRPAVQTLPPTRAPEKTGRNLRPPARGGPPSQTTTGRSNPPAPNRQHRGAGALGNPTPKKPPGQPPHETGWRNCPAGRTRA